MNESIAGNDAEVVRQYLTSVKQIRRRDGRVELFDRRKIERSITNACRSYGLDTLQTASVSTKTADAVLTHLQHTCDGYRVPLTDDVRTAVAAALIRLAWAPIAECYLSYSKSPSSIPRMNSSTFNDTKTTMVHPDMNARRRRLPDERRSITHKFEIGQHQGYITVGLYDDGSPGELFLTMSKEGSVLSGLVDAFATSVSIGLQYGVPLKVLVTKFAHMRFEPAGETQNPNIPIATSIVDYVFRWLAIKFLSPEDRQALGIHGGFGAANTTHDVPVFQRERQQSIGFENE